MSSSDALDALNLTPAQAAVRAAADEVLLIDIREPHEWALTGTAEHAQLLEGSRPDFQERLSALTGNHTDTAIALICAGGVRSAAMQQRLRAAGYSLVYNVVGGMHAWGDLPRRMI